MPEHGVDGKEYDDLVREALGFLREGDSQSTLGVIDRLMSLDEDRAEGFFLLGLTALEMNEKGRALELFERAINQDPECYEYAELLANLYTQTGRLNDGLYFAKLSTTLSPHPTIEGLLPLRYSNYFTSLQAAAPSTNYLHGLPKYKGRRFMEAIRHFEREVRLNPTNAACQRDLGDSLAEIGRYSEALDHLTRAAELDPNDASTRFKLGALCYRLGEFKEATLQHKAALLHDPDSLELASAVLMWSSMLPAGWSQIIEEFKQALNVRLEKAPGLPPEANTFAGEPHAGSPASGSTAAKVRIGYLSNRFAFGHQARMIEALFQLHNRKKFEVTMYQQSFGSDSTTQRLRSMADVTRYVASLDDELLAVIISGDEIDILVDLCAEDCNNRATVLNMRPARIQVGGWGGGMGIGIPGIDFVIADDVTADAITADLAPWQQVHKLDYGLYAFHPREMMPPVNELPAVSTGTPAIGVLCDPSAITMTEAALLARILEATPKAHILLGGTAYADREAYIRIKSLFTDLGIAGRVDVSSHQKYADQLIVDPDYWLNIDIFLDVGRHMSAATVGDALWMGVPVLALKGVRAQDRLGASAVYTAARPGWIAGTADELIEKAVAMIGNLDELAELRRSLRGEMRRALLFNPEPHVRAIERAYLRLLGREAEID